MVSMWYIFSFYITIKNAHHKNALVKIHHIFMLLSIILARMQLGEKIVNSSRTCRQVYPLYFVKGMSPMPELSLTQAVVFSLSRRGKLPKSNRINMFSFHSIILIFLMPGLVNEI